ncbi:DUF3148 domain-containing protein [Prochlorothrix hollandica]|uniref:DUF3148 domain-containing protein n=1 Tax=Prochlorothrix hollandica TaxID=1223 RepID=UPI0003483C91|nr:DUF3148 domain-containing protein [Prochlorothrix hollandica]
MNPSFAIGDRVQLAQRPPYLKTAEPRPMLRPPDLVPLRALGSLVEQRTGNTWVVRFDQGNFLVDTQYLEWLDMEQLDVKQLDVKQLDVKQLDAQQLSTITSEELSHG